jgi:hypothetical protein
MMSNLQPSRETKRKVNGAVFGLAAGSALVLLVFYIVQTYALASTIRENQKLNVKTNELIASCVTPDGKCAQDGAKRTGEAVANIGRLSIYAAACADTPGVQGAPAIERCVKGLLAEDAAERDRNPQ